MNALVMKQFQPKRSLLLKFEPLTFKSKPYAERLDHFSSATSRSFMIILYMTDKQSILFPAPFSLSQNLQTFPFKNPFSFDFIESSHSNYLPLISVDSHFHSVNYITQSSHNHLTLKPQETFNENSASIQSQLN